MTNTITCHNLRNSFLGGANSIGLISPQTLGVSRKMKMKFCVQNLKGLNKSSAATFMARKEVKAMAAASSALLTKPPSLLIADETSSATATPPKEKKKLQKRQAKKKVEDSVDRASGKYGMFGGKFVPETLMTWLTILEAEFNLALHDPSFQVWPPSCFVLFICYDCDYIGRDGNE